MKKIIALLLLVSLNAIAQNFNLANISSGDHISFRAIFDRDDNLFGYFSLYHLGKKNGGVKEFEIFILDKNLNTVLSNKASFDQQVYTIVPYVNVDGFLILSPRVSAFGMSSSDIKDYKYPKAQKLDLKINEISSHVNFCFENNEFFDCPENKSYRDEKKQLRKEKKEKEFVEDNDVYKLKNLHYLVFLEKDFFKFVKDNEIRYYTPEKELLWSFKYNLEGNKKSREYFRLLHYDDNKFYGFLTENDNGKITRHLMIFDIKTGMILKKEKIDAFTKETVDNMLGDRSDFNYHTDDDKVLIFFNTFNSYYNTGYGYVKIDKQNDNISFKNISFGTDLKSKYPIVSKYGQVENGYSLSIRDIYFLEDGSIKILTEKFKISGAKMKNTDMVFISTNSNFEVNDVFEMKKEKSKWSYSDYMFSQKINDKKDVVFFYKDFQKDDETKDKNWILFINTLINGKFNQEQITISSKNDKYTTIPYVAKEGYILLREYNDIEKYNQIRLERLNY
jgi:hypothetical protein